jgi:hypothetical protein
MIRNRIQGYGEIGTGDAAVMGLGLAMQLLFLYGAYRLGKASKGKR